MRKILYCYAEGKGDRWEAICLDLDLAVQGRSLAEVRSSLNQAIVDYLEYVATLPQDEQSAFLSRRVPLGLRLRMIWVLLRTALSRTRVDDGHNRSGFVLDCHA